MTTQRNQKITISGVVSCIQVLLFSKSAKVGMSHQEFETAIGATYTAVMDEGADYDYPSATFTFHATLSSGRKRTFVHLGHLRRCRICYLCCHLHK